MRDDIENLVAATAADYVTVALGDLYGDMIGHQQAIDAMGARYRSGGHVTLRTIAETIAETSTTTANARCGSRPPASRRPTIGRSSPTATPTTPTTRQTKGGENMMLNWETMGYRASTVTASTGSPRRSTGNGACGGDRAAATG